MTTTELLSAGRLDDCLASLKKDIRSKPAEPKLRVFLFQLLTVMGDWDGAMTQLNVAADMDSDCQLMAQVCRQLLNCEVLRKEVFAGNRSPLIFGEPAPWIGLLVQAAHLIAKGEWDAAAELRDQAFDQAPASAGDIDSQAFEWIADADTRLGPMLEIIVEGRYYWAPYSGIKTIAVEEPQDLRDAVWMPATFVWKNEGEATGFIPTRYPGSENHPNDTVKLARSTVWEEREHGHAVGCGQRMLATDSRDVALMDTRTVRLTA